MIDYTRCIMFAILEASMELKPELPNPSIINPLSLVDAYLRQIIECAKGPLCLFALKAKVCALTVCSAPASGQCL